MPSSLALLITVVFIAALFATEPRSRKRVSPSLWIPFIWFLGMSGIKPFSVWLGRGPTPGTLVGDALSQGSPIDRNIMILLILAGFYILFRKGRNISFTFRSNKLLIFLLVFSGMSLFWSDFPFITLKRWIKEIGNVLMVLVVFTEANRFAAIKELFKRLTFLLIPLSVTLIRYFPDMGKKYTPWGEFEYVGAAASKNMLGLICLLAVMYFGIEYLIEENRAKTGIGVNSFLKSVLFVMLLYLIYTSRSFSSIICTAVFLLSVFLSKKFDFLKRANLHYLFMIASILGAFLIDLLIYVFQNFVGVIGKDITISGRIPLWQEVVGMVPHPLIGAGYDSFWLGERLYVLWEHHWWHPNQAHNGYLEIYLNLGLIGLALVLIVIIRNFKYLKFLYLENKELGIFYFSLLCVILAFNVVESSLAKYIVLWFLFLLVSFDLGMTGRRARTDTSAQDGSQ